MISKRAIDGGFYLSKEKGLQRLTAFAPNHASHPPLVYNELKHRINATRQGTAMKRILLLYLVFLAPFVSAAQDIDETIRAAESGDPIAQNILGNRYDNGLGVPQDYTEAVKWYRKAAEQGHASAQFNLGFMYANGQGVPQNYSDAYVWFSLAAATGHEDAIYNRDVVVKKLSPQDLSAAQQRAAKLFEEIEARKAAQE